MVVQTKPKGSCRFFHNWIKQCSSNTYTLYYQCKNCKAKKIVQADGSYQPIDWVWFNDTST